MESSSKRRKIEHAGSGLRHDAIIDFEARSSAQVSTASTFILQTDELLKEAKLNYGKAFSDANGHLFKIKEIVEAIEPHDALPITEATAAFEKKHRIVVPHPDPKPAADSPYKVAFAKPSQCNVVGSYVSKTMVKSQPSASIDMVVQMPKSLFQDKDFMNMRYFYRRAYYIAYIAAHVREQFPADSMGLTFEYLNENPLLPVLVLRPRSPDDKENGTSKDGKSTKKSHKSMEYSIRLIPCAPDGLFPWSKLTPASSCNRTADGDEHKASNTGTPFYNSTINAERTFIQYLRVLEDCKTKCPAFSDACVLGRIWLQQRGFGGAISRGGFGNFEWSAMIALLLHMGGKKGQAALSTSLSSTELFKAAIQFLSTTDFNKKPFAFGVSKVDAKAIREAGPVMFDPIREVNILFKMTPWSASLLQLYAKSTADLLADDAVDKFDPTFIMKTDVAPEVFDTSFKITSPDVSSKFSNSADRSSASWKFSLEAHKVLKRAYGDRAQLVHIQQQPVAPWSLSRNAPGESSEVLVGVIFQPANMSRGMEYGPSAEEQKEAAVFRQFWGEKAELRRFKDGSILECVEWTSKLPGKICEEIARYALKRHLKIMKDELVPLDSGVSSVIGLSHLDKEAFDASRRAFTTFERDIRNLEDLPLQIRQLSPISPFARYSSVEPPMLGFLKSSIEPMDVNLYFEASSKWPENLTAIQEAKIEFLLDIDRRLTAAHENITTYLGRENREIGIESLAYLDVVYESGAAFRLRIHCDLEETLLERQVDNKTLDLRTREDAVEGLQKFHWLYDTLPLHTQTIATFCTRLQPLSQTIRLVKHWFGSHKLTGHISEELIELIVLHVFLQPYPWIVPSSPSTGFLRTLFFLSRWDWRDEPLIVDSAETLTNDDRLSIRHELESWRKRDPHMNKLVMCVATSSDKSGLGYTRDGPSKLIASRMTRLAKAACKLVREEPLAFDPAALFETSLRDYDVLLRLSPKAVRAIVGDAATDPAAKKHSHFKNLDERTGKMPLPVRAHPVDVLAEELQRVYDDTLVFFRGGDGDDVLAAIWNPRLQQRQKFRAGLPYNFRSAKDEGDEDGADVVEVNQEAVLLEIARAGGAMIKKIEVIEG
ncbi:pre-rRNA processing protein Utp22 [Purpureocillium lilacinum]|uniref:U3 small nucleolar RNA-associated protein 22 n=1 Tax=Purpureocillium lilacinum TaxID=33203 RepID=A0A179GN09_PURLI|nr:pre-rRNA processing protein Utp22 [Purpureocillium lilacinum]PWI72518.1 pre-rRNA processing protein Utp22 [Purpureocillium lilacinum]